METMKEILQHYRFGPEDAENLPRLAQLLLPLADTLAEEFYEYLAAEPQTARFFPTPQAVERRKATIKGWLQDLLSSPYDNRLLRRIERIGKVHVRIGLRGHFVNAAMHFVWDFGRRQVVAQASDPAEREELLGTLDKILDIHLDVLTSSYREAELQNVFLSRRFETALVRWAERALHGLNLVLMVGLLAMAAGVLSLFVSDVIHAFGTNLERGVIQALGSLLILWMMIELLQAEIEHLRGGSFHVRLFLELALVAFIRKLFIAALEHLDLVSFALLLGSILVLGLIFFLMVRAESRARA